MEIEATSADRNLLLEMKGELDHHGARNALRELELSIDAALPKKLVLDLAGVTFMDSSGIGLAMGRYNRVKELDGSIVIIPGTPYISRVLGLSGLFGIIPKSASKQKALEYIFEKGGHISEAN